MDKNLECQDKGEWISTVRGPGQMGYWEEIKYYHIIQTRSGMEKWKHREMEIG